jgi:hypothetical protein
MSVSSHQIFTKTPLTKEMGHGEIGTLNRRKCSNLRGKMRHTQLGSLLPGKSHKASTRAKMPNENLDCTSDVQRRQIPG